MKYILCPTFIVLLVVHCVQAAEVPFVELRVGGGVCSASFSPDGTKIVTAAKDRTASIWDAATGEKLLTLPHPDWVRTAAFSPDGKRIATSGDDRTARIWDVETGKELKQLDSYILFSPDGKNIATVGVNEVGERISRIRDMESGHERHRLVGGRPLFSPNGKVIATIDDDITIDAAGFTGNRPTLVRIWDIESGKEVFQREIPGLSGQGTKVAFSPDGKKVVTNSGWTKVARTWENRDFESWENYAQIWDIESGKEVQTLVGHKDFISSIAFSEDGKRIITTSEDETARIWDAESGKELQKLQGDPNDRIDITQAWHSTVFRMEVWERGGLAKVQFGDAAFSPDGKYILTTGNAYDKTFRIWDTESGKELHVLRGYERELILDASFSPDGKRIVTEAKGLTIRIWTLK